MKRTALKIATALIALTLLACGILGIIASANETDATAELKVVTLNYGAELSLAYAYELSGIEPAEAELHIYKDASLEGAYTVSAFSGSYYNETLPVYYSSGVSAKDIAAVLYAVPVLKATGEVIGETAAYSVLEYCYDTLYNESAPTDLKELVTELIEYGAKAQLRLINIGNIPEQTLITDYVYIYTEDPSILINGKANALVKLGDTVTVSSESCSSFRVSDGEGNASYIYGNSASFVAEGSACVEVDSVEHFEAADPNIYFDGSEVTSVYLTNKNDNAEYGIVSDPKDAANKVLRVKNTVATAGGSSHSFIYAKPVNSAETGNCASFTSSVYFEPFANSGDVIFYFYLRGASKDQLSYSLASKYNANTTATLKNEYSGKSVATVYPGVWYDIRIEAYTLGGSTLVQLYLGERGGELALADETRLLPSFEVDLVYFKQIGAKATGAVYYDDMCLENLNKELKTEIPLYQASEYAEDFSGGETTTDKLTTSGSSAINTVTVEADPTDPDNKALKVVGTYGSSSSQFTTSVALANPDAAGNCYVFEGRFYLFDSDPSNSEGNDEVQISFQGSSRHSRLGLNLSPAGDWVYVTSRSSATGNASITTTSSTPVRFSASGWYNLRIEVYATGDKTTCYTKIYIGEDGYEPQFVADYLGYEKPELTSLSSVILFWQKYNTAYTLYLDDVSFYKIDKTFVAGGN